VAYADDGYIKAKLSVTLEVLSDVKHVLKEDAGLDLNFDKTKILVEGISAADAHAAAQRMLNADLSLAHLSPLLSPASLVVDGYIGLGVPIGTDAFIQHFAKDKCVYYCSTYYKAVRVWGGGNNGGHVLRGTTSRGLCGLVCPSRTSERGGEGYCVKGGGRRRGA
jgi:hypothetical protein